MTNRRAFIAGTSALLVISATGAALAVPVRQEADAPVAVRVGDDDWLVCNGQFVAEAEYPELSALMAGNTARIPGRFQTPKLSSYPPRPGEYNVPEGGRAVVYAMKASNRNDLSHVGEIHLFLMPPVVS